MKPSLTDTLCTRCGLCCDGSLFADVEIASRNEATILEVMGLEIEDADAADAGLLLQPCAALKGKRCSVYAHRPECCRTFECRLLQRVQRGSIGVVAAKAKITETLRRIEDVRELALQFGQIGERLPLRERCMETLLHSERVVADPEMNQKRAELKMAMASVERLLRENFLGGGRPQRSPCGRSGLHQVPTGVK